MKYEKKYKLSIILDSQGFLKNYKIWNHEIALIIAIRENILLTNEHWKIITTVRKFYIQTNKTPAVRELIKIIKQKYGKKIGNSLNLQKLFPISPAIQTAKISGLPKPNTCI